MKSVRFFMKRQIFYTGSIIKSYIRLFFLYVILSVILLGGCGRKPVSSGTTDEMFEQTQENAEIYVFMFEDRIYTVDTIDEISTAAGESMKDGGFYKLTADVTYLNGGVAGYVNYPKIKRVSKCEEISPLELNLPDITKKRYGLCKIGDYADGDIFLNEYGKIAVWQDGAWIYRYEKEYDGEDGTLICCLRDVPEDTINAGVRDGVLSCREYFVVPPQDSGDASGGD